MSYNNQKENLPPLAANIVNEKAEYLTNKYKLNLKQVYKILKMTVVDKEWKPITDLSVNISNQEIEINYWPSLEYSLNYLSPNDAVNLFETEDINDLRKRIDLTNYVRDPETPFYDLDELSDLTWKQIKYQKLNKKTLIEKGYPATRIEGLSFSNDRTSLFRPFRYLYFIKVPIGLETFGLYPTRYIYTWAKGKSPHDSECTYNEAPILDGLSYEDAYLLNKGREEFFNLRLDILHILYEAVKKGDASGLWGNCLSILQKYLSSDKANFYVRIDQFVIGENRIKTLGFEEDSILTTGGLIDLILLIGHFVKEIKIGTMNNFKSYLLRVNIEYDNSFGGFGFPPLYNYFEIANHSNRTKFDRGLDFLISLVEQEEVFWEEYTKDVINDMRKALNVDIELVWRKKLSDYKSILKDLNIRIRNKRKRYEKLDSPPQFIYKNHIEEIDDKSFIPGPDFRSIYWRGEKFSFTSQQAQVIEILYEAYINKTPELSHAYILERLGTPSSKLKDTFRKHPGFHAAWGTLIIEGRTKGTVRLNI